MFHNKIQLSFVSWQDKIKICIQHDKIKLSYVSQQDTI